MRLQYVYLLSFCGMNRAVSLSFQTLSALRKRVLKGDNQTFCNKCRSLFFRHSIQTSSRLYGVFEPDNLKVGPEIPEYDKINIRLRGYDFVTLEAFYEFVYKMTQLFSIESSRWVSPAHEYDVKTYQPYSTKTAVQYTLLKYERTVQILNTSSTKLPIFIEYLRMNTPQGIEVTFKEFDEEEDSLRYVEDITIKQLQEEIALIDKQRDERKKKKL